MTLSPSVLFLTHVVLLLQVVMLLLYPHLRIWQVPFVALWLIHSNQLSVHKSWLGRKVYSLWQLLEVSVCSLNPLSKYST